MTQQRRRKAGLLRSGVALTMTLAATMMTGLMNHTGVTLVPTVPPTTTPSTTPLTLYNYDGTTISDDDHDLLGEQTQSTVLFVLAIALICGVIYGMCFYLRRRFEREQSISSAERRQTALTNDFHVDVAADLPPSYSQAFVLSRPAAPPAGGVRRIVDESAGKSLSRCSIGESSTASLPAYEDAIKMAIRRLPPAARLDYGAPPQPPPPNTVMFHLGELDANAPCCPTDDAGVPAAEATLAPPPPPPPPPGGAAGRLRHVATAPAQMRVRSPHGGATGASVRQPPPDSDVALPPEFHSFTHSPPDVNSFTYPLPEVNPIISPTPEINSIISLPSEVNCIEPLSPEVNPIVPPPPDINSISTTVGQESNSTAQERDYTNDDRFILRVRL
ncbi:PREDICTED: histone-lysine N-methyltransferase 2D-like isoform X2 [Priapulus caudatus]|uniref:Histone-lysine N-methyltransferase 2D-like isoform X2 n=1 Tax=Priapulus caudatus TaxID=37621 RepID=A0ABM1EN00_PRICU|nr:PREDICTED: histone-lysine N-methyltransferase 2D-like isoform X2 [Priapulus caudatus]